MDTGRPQSPSRRRLLGAFAALAIGAGGGVFAAPGAPQPTPPQPTPSQPTPPQPGQNAPIPGPNAPHPGPGGNALMGPPPGARTKPRTTPREPGAVVGESAYTMVAVPAGSFRRGSPEGEPGRWDDEGPVADVHLSRPLLVGATEVTVRLWMDVNGQATPIDGSLPVTNVGWADAVRFCNRLSALEGLTEAYRVGMQDPWAGVLVIPADWDRRSDGYRLLTEAEWEYAARAGQPTRFPGSEDPAQVAWTAENAGGHIAPVATLRPNAWGLYDMGGNAWEWVWDRAGPYSAGELTNPQGPSVGFFHVVRGGSWRHDASAARVAMRGWISQNTSFDAVGFRIARDAPVD